MWETGHFLFLYTLVLRFGGTFFILIYFRQIRRINLRPYLRIFRQLFVAEAVYNPEHELAYRLSVMQKILYAFIRDMHERVPPVLLVNFPVNLAVLFEDFKKP